jgi:hypothetical protein
MSKRLNKETIEKLQELKSLGLTLRTIAKQFGISAQTVLIHTKGIKSIKTIKKCSFPGCQRKHSSKGLCVGHWFQNKKYGFLRPITTGETLEERFWRQVKKPENKDGCWLWIGTGRGKGYGSFYYKRNYMAHRISYELHKGKIGKGMQLDHLCRNKACVNPDHLEIVTNIENMRRMKFYYNILNEIDRLRNLVWSLGGNPDTNILPN